MAVFITIVLALLSTFILLCNSQNSAWREFEKEEMLMIKSLAYCKVVGRHASDLAQEEKKKRYKSKK